MLKGVITRALARAPLERAESLLFLSVTHILYIFVRDEWCVWILAEKIAQSLDALHKL